MPLPTSLRKSIDQKLNDFCKKRVPENLHDKIKLSYKIRGNNVTIIESRPYFKDPSKWSHMNIAQLRFNSESEDWTLYFSDRNDRWHIYYDLDPSKNIEDLLKEIDEDPTYIFGG